MSTLSHYSEKLLLSTQYTTEKSHGLHDIKADIYVVMTRSETKLSVAIPAPLSGQSAVNLATATSKCSITFLLPYDQDGDVKTKQDSVSNTL